jgi:excisionase family DNA binding protein
VTPPTATPDVSAGGVIADLKEPPYTVPEVAATLRVGRATVYQLVQSGHLGSVRLGKTIRITRGQLERYLAGHSTGPNRPAA